MFDAQTLALMILVPALSQAGPDAYSDVVARARRVYDRGTRCDRAHETAHFLHAEQRLLRPGHAVFYLGHGRAVAVREPAVRLSDVAPIEHERAVPCPRSRSSWPCWRWWPWRSVPPGCSRT